MADLNETLATPMQGVDTPKPVGGTGTGFLGALASVGSLGLNAVVKGQQISHQRYEQARQKLADQRAIQERSAKNDAALTGFNLLADPMGTNIGNTSAPTTSRAPTGDTPASYNDNPTPPPVDASLSGSPAYQEALQTAQSITPQMSSIQTAASQGRGMNPSVVEARTAAMMRQALAAHPGFAADMLSFWKEQGITSRLTYDYDTTVDKMKAQSTADQARANQVDDNLALHMGIDINSVPPEQRQELRLLSIKDLHTQETHKDLLQALEIEGKTQGIEAGRTAAANTAEDRLKVKLGENAFQGTANRLNAMIGQVQQLAVGIAGDETKSPEERQRILAERWQVIKIAATKGMGDYMTLYGGRMKPEDRSELQGMFDRGMTATEGLITGPHSFLQQQKDNMEFLTSKLNMSAVQAAPFLHSLNTVLGPNATGLLVMNSGLLQRPEIQAAVNAELKGFSSLTEAAQGDRVRNFLKVLKGEMRPQDLDPKENIAHASTYLNLVTTSGKNDEIRNGRDKAGHTAALAAIEGVSTNLSRAVPQWGASSLIKVLDPMSSPATLRLLLHPGADKEHTTQVVNEYQAAMQNAYIALKQAPSSDPYYNAVFMVDKGEWGYRRNKNPAMDNVTPYGRYPGGDPKVSQETIDRIRVLNTTLQGQKSLGRLGFDPALKGHNVNDNELTQYYHNGTLPASVVQDRAKASTANVDNFNKGVDKALQEVFTAPAQGEMPNDLSGKIAGAENNTGNPSAKNPHSSATGDGQFTTGTWLHVMNTYHPELVKGKTPQEILAMRSDPKLSLQAIDEYAAENKRFLAGHGINAGDNELSLAHFTGPADAVHVLKASNDTPVQSVISPKSYAANTFLHGWNVAKLKAWAARRLNG